MIGKRFIFILINLLFVSIAFGEVAMKISPADITQGESFSIQYKILSNRTDIEPDFAALKKEFTVLGQHSTLQMTIVNGRSSTITTWGLTLIPKRFGVITIPPVRFGTEFSEPRDINVSKANEVTLKKQRARAFIKVEVDQKNPYVQSQVTYSIKMYYAIDIARGSIAAPNIKDTVTFRLTNDKQYQSYYNNQLYNVLERNYAIFPQKSGSLLIEPTTFSGIEQVRGSSDYAYTGRPLHLTSKKIRLKIKPIPISLIGSTWLPAKSLELREAWSTMPSQLTVGTPITRTIIVSARGLTSAQLPDLGRDNVIGFNVYPNKAIVNDQVTDKSIIGQRKEKITYIPNETGELSLPAVDVSWWNIKTKKIEVAHLDGHRFKVFASGKKNTTEPMSDTTSMSSPYNPFVDSVHKAPKSFAWFKPHYLIYALLVIWLVTFIIGIHLWWARRRSELPSQAHTRDNKKRYQSKAKRQLKAACIGNDPLAAKSALFDWAHNHWPAEPIINLHQVSDRLRSEDLAVELQRLDQLLYAKSNKSWDGERLWDAFTKASGGKKRFQFRKKRISQLPPLYPS